MIDPLFYSNSQPANISIPSMNYTPTYAGGNAPISQLFANMGAQLKPMGQYTKDNPYEQFAAPYRETLNSWEKTFARPEFQQFTANPWERNYSNMLATSGASLMGGAKNRYENAKNQVWQPYYNKVQDAQSQMENMIRNFYNTGIQNYYDSPTAFRA